MNFTQSVTALGIIVGSLASAQSQSPRLEHEPTGRNFGTNSGLSVGSAEQQDLQLPIRYHGGGVLKGNVNLYPIWSRN